MSDKQPQRPFAEELKARRKSRDIKAAALATRLGVSTADVSRWENEAIRYGAVAFPEDREHILGLSEALDWPLDEIQAAVDITRRRLLSADAESAELRDHGILYAAGWSELTPETKQDLLKYIGVLVERQHKNRE